MKERFKCTRNWIVSNKYLVISIILLVVFLAMVLMFILIPICYYNYKLVWIEDGSSISITNIYYVASIIGILVVPIAVIFIQNMLDKNKTIIGGSNTELLKEVWELKAKIEQLTLQEITVETGTDKRDRLKAQALKLVNVSFIANTKVVADKLEISKEDAFDLLQEMVMHDKIISCAGRCNADNIDGVLWTTK